LTVLTVILILGLLAAGIFVSNMLRERAPSQVAQNPDSTDTQAPSLAAPEQLPNSAESEDGQVPAGSAASPSTESGAQSASPQPAAPVKNDAGNCQYQIAAEFENYLGVNSSVAQELGCPKGVPVLLSFETQFFQTGMALGRLDKPIVYLHYFSNDEWEQREHAWRPGMQEAVDSPDLLSPAEELFQPVRGIGQIWAENLFVRQALGWASAQPVEANGILQSFEGGLLIYNSDLQDTISFLNSQLRR